MLVPDQMRECACFAFVCVGEETRAVGTAFFASLVVGETESGIPTNFPLLITALHVVAKARTTEGGDGCVYIRVNTTSGGAEFVKVEDELWVLPEQAPLAVDVAVCAWPYGNETYEFKSASIKNWLTDEVSKAETVGVGDDLFLTGLFVNHHGKERNVPIVRVGNIATMPGEPVATKLGPMEAYLVEARSVGGLSGSPVFLNLGTFRLDSHGNARRREGGLLWYLLGVMHGHWHIPGGETDAVVDDGLSEEYVNMGIAIVTPITKVVGLLDDPKIQGPLAQAKREFAAVQARSLP
ncbi:MAG: hypothetical protein ACHQE6_03325 [Solirubrobacterales bacterium]